jgi:hypothetical protein
MSSRVLRSLATIVAILASLLAAPRIACAQQAIDTVKILAAAVEAVRPSARAPIRLSLVEPQPPPMSRPHQTHVPLSIVEAVSRATGIETITLSAMQRECTEAPRALTKCHFGAMNSLIVFEPFPKLEGDTVRVSITLAINNEKPGENLTTRYCDVFVVRNGGSWKATQAHCSSIVS